MADRPGLEMSSKATYLPRRPGGAPSKPPARQGRRARPAPTPWSIGWPAAPSRTSLSIRNGSMRSMERYIAGMCELPPTSSAAARTTASWTSAPALISLGRDWYEKAARSGSCPRRRSRQVVAIAATSQRAQVAQSQLTQIPTDRLDLHAGAVEHDERREVALRSSRRTRHVGDPSGPPSAAFASQACTTLPTTDDHTLLDQPELVQSTEQLRLPPDSRPGSC
jgi:hypothetical protein